ncbi:MAG: YlbF family regulator [Phycisphaerales bacterium]|nr:YlbF family regulator [Phycisphaerales bacterium]
MHELNEIIEEARGLGELIARHPRLIAYAAARKAVSSDREANRLLSDYARQADRMRHLEAEQRPIGVDDKRKLAELEQQFASNELLKTLMRAQADFVEMMGHINRAMEAPMSAVLPQDHGS